MTHAVPLALLCLALVAPSAHADFGRSCQPRALTAAEKQAGERTLEQLRKALPGPPAGWSLRGEQSSVGSGSCKDEASGRMVAQPVSVVLTRSYTRNDPAPAAPPPPPPQAAPAPDPARQARIGELEKQLAALQRKERDAVTAYQNARRAGDSAAQREATEASRRLRAEMDPLQKELRELRGAMRNERAAAGEASTRAAQARMAEARANRRDASLSAYANSRQANARGGLQPITIEGAPLALREAGGVVHLLFGPWQRSGNFATAAIDESLPTTRVQSLSVRLDASEQASEQFLKGLNMSALAQTLR